MSTVEVIKSTLAILVAIVSSSTLLVLSFHFGWAGRWLSDVILSGIVAIIVMVAWPQSQILPVWMRLVYWFIILISLRWLARHVQQPPSTTMQNHTTAFVYDIDEADDGNIEEYFNFEEVIG